jgi:hypothetical protein
MDISIKSRKPVIACIAVSMIAIMAGTCAANEETRGQTAASVRMPAQAANATSPDGRQCADQPFLVGPDGHKFPLAYVPGFGCQYVVDENSVVLAVGPNGYAFAWTRENGWKLLKTVD